MEPKNLNFQSQESYPVNMSVLTEGLVYLLYKGLKGPV